MLHVPILRNGKSYESMDKATIVDHATGDPIAEMSMANSGLLVRDVDRMNDRCLEHFKMSELLDICRKAADIYLNGTLPVGDSMQSFEDYIQTLSATTGMPIKHCRTNASKIHRVLNEIDVVLRGLTRGFDLSILDRGYGEHQGGMLSYFREGRIFGAVLPSNSPGVHGLWVPAIALKAPVVIKPGREEPWSPLRIIQSYIAAGIPEEAFGFYPTDHGGAAELLRVTDRSMLFGDANTTKAWANDPRVELHGPGYSKVIFGEDMVDDWEKYIDLIVTSCAANGGRSCINASSVWAPRHTKEIAQALAERLGKVQAYPAADDRAEVAAFANTAMAERMSEMIDGLLKTDGAVDLTEGVRGGSRLVNEGRCRYLLPTVVHCESREHPVADREFLFPFVTVIECPQEELASGIGSTLVCTALTKDADFRAQLMAAENIDRLNFGEIPTIQLAWDQPHEGNLFEHLYRQRAFQVEHAA
ncbi:MAG: aldehyde dehydrogenase family protein [Phycisphaerae bacterium]